MKSGKPFNIATAILLGLILGVLFGFFMPGRYEFLLPAVDLVSGLYMNTLLGKCGVQTFFKAIMPAALNAFGTCSSSATLFLWNGVIRRMCFLCGWQIWIFRPRRRCWMP